MAYLRGFFRLASSALIIVGTALAVVATSWIPIELRQIRLSGWIFTLGARMVMFTLGLRFVCTDPQRVAQHHGFIFSNHVSFFDTLVMAHAVPVRFIAKAEVKHWPFIGWIARATGTLFVEREDRVQRATVRQAVGENIQTQQYPPIVVFPEGTRNPLDTLLPFRYGVFDIALQTGMPYLLCAIHYERTESMTWHSRNESLMTTVRRIVLQDPSRVWLIPLELVQPQPDDSPQDLAYQAREIVGTALVKVRAEG